MNRTITLVSLLTSMVLAVAGTPAYAALGGPSGIVIPYAGKLELDGALVTGCDPNPWVDVRSWGIPGGTACPPASMTRLSLPRRG